MLLYYLCYLMFFYVKYNLLWLVSSWIFPLDIYSKLSKDACMNLEAFP